MLERVPADEHRPRLLAVPEAQQEVRESEQRVARLPLRAAEGLGQGVVGAVGERVAVDHEQRLAQSPSPSRSIATPRA